MWTNSIIQCDYSSNYMEESSRILVTTETVYSVIYFSECSSVVKVFTALIENTISHITLCIR